MICVCSSKVEAVRLPASVHPSSIMYNYYNYVTYFSKRDTFTQNNLIKCLHSCTCNWSPFHHFVHEVNELGILEQVLL